MIDKNLQTFFNYLKTPNPFGEMVTLVGATKFVSVDDINLAISLGLKDIGENKAQEFRDKFNLVNKVNYHFIGTLQTNKVKYLIGKAHLIQSVSSLELANEISKQSQVKGVVTNILIQVNIGQEENKHGFSLSSVDSAVNYASNLPNVKVLGLMAMLPFTSDENVLTPLMKSMRSAYDQLKDKYNFKYLSMGMTEDYKLAIKMGSNMVRIGTGIFGKRV